jgi:hypothetical protein
MATQNRADADMKIVGDPAKPYASALAGLRASATGIIGTVFTRNKCRRGFGRCAT